MGILLMNSSMFYKAMGYTQGGQTSVQEYPSDVVNAVDVAADLLNRGYSKAAVAGILGNIYAETGGSFDPAQKEIQGTGVGLFQFTPKGGHYEAYYQDYLTEDKNDDILSQVDYMHESIYGNYQDVLGRKNALDLGSSLKATEDPEEAARLFMDMWEKPHKDSTHWDKRRDAALKYYNLLP